MKDNIAHVASFAGELYLFDISTPSPRANQSIGRPDGGRRTPGRGNLAKLND